MQVYKLPTAQLYATYFGGDEKLGLDPDLDAKNIWLKYLPESRVLPFGCKVSPGLCRLSAKSVFALPAYGTV